MGKSTAALGWQKLGASIVDTDDLARHLLRKGSAVLLELRNRFGDGLVDGEGCLIRSRLADLIFDDSAARAQVQALLHPRIREMWLETVCGWRSSAVKLGVVIIPLLYETGVEGVFDAVAVAASSEAAQLSRIRERGWTPLELERRSRAQLSAEEKIRRGDFVLWNESTVEVLLEQITCVNHTLLSV